MECVRNLACEISRAPTPKRERILAQEAIVTRLSVQGVNGPGGVLIDREDTGPMALVPDKKEDILALRTRKIKAFASIVGTLENWYVVKAEYQKRNR